MLVGLSSLSYSLLPPSDEDLECCASPVSEHWCWSTRRCQDYPMCKEGVLDWWATAEQLHHSLILKFVFGCVVQSSSITWPNRNTNTNLNRSSHTVSGVCHNPPPPPIDSLSMSSQKALEEIGNKLQKQYERWQPRARYKQLLDPTTDDVRKLCMALRKNAKVIL